MEITVTYDDDRTVEVRPTPYNIVAFERHYKIGVGELRKDPKTEHVLWMAWHRLNQIGQEAADFETFLQKLGPIDGVSYDANPPLPPPAVSPT